MSTQNIEEQIIDYLNGELSVEDTKVFELLLDSDPHIQQQVRQYQELATSIDACDEIQVPVALKSNFDAFLNAYDGSEKVAATESPKVFKLFGGGFQQAAIVLLILGIGLLIGLNLGNKGVIDQYAADHELMMDLLKEQSTSQRIKGVSMSHDLQKNTDVIQMLVEILMEDDSPNVRLQSVEALGIYKEDPGVRQALIHAASKDKDAMVQIAAIQLLKQVQHQDVISTFDNIIQDRNAMNFVRDEAHSGKLQLIQNTTY